MLHLKEDAAPDDEKEKRGRKELSSFHSFRGRKELVILKEGRSQVGRLADRGEEEEANPGRNGSCRAARRTAAKKRSSSRVQQSNAPWRVRARRW